MRVVLPSSPSRVLKPKRPVLAKQLPIHIILMTFTAGIAFCYTSPGSVATFSRRKPPFYNSVPSEHPAHHSGPMNYQPNLSQGPRTATDETLSLNLCSISQCCSFPLLKHLCFCVDALKKVVGYSSAKLLTSCVPTQYPLRRQRAALASRRRGYIQHQSDHQYSTMYIR